MARALRRIHWSDWFDGMTVSQAPNGETVLHWRLADQAALHGVLVQIRDLGLPLLEVCQLEPGASEPDSSVDGQAQAPTSS